MVPRVVHLLCNIILTSLEVGRILIWVSTPATRIETQSSTLVAMTSWSRMPRFSAHSPIKTSEDSSWLKVR